MTLFYIFGCRQDRSTQPAQTRDPRLESLLQTLKVCFVSTTTELFWLSKACREGEDGTMFLRK